MPPLAGLAAVSTARFLQLIVAEYVEPLLLLYVPGGAGRLQTTVLPLQQILDQRLAANHATYLVHLAGGYIAHLQLALRIAQHLQLHAMRLDALAGKCLGIKLFIRMTPGPCMVATGPLLVFLLVAFGALARNAQRRFIPMPGGFRIGGSQGRGGSQE